MSEDIKKNKNIISKGEIVKKILVKFNENVSSNGENSKPRVSETLISSVITSFLEEILSSVSEGNNVTITNFFSIRSKLSKARKSRNFKTGEEISIPERITPKISFSVNFKNVVKEGKNYE